MNVKTPYGDRDESQATHEEHVARMKAYYAGTAQSYNSWHCDTGNDSCHNFAVRELMRLIESRQARSVLDVCCGTGRATKAMLDAGIEAHGIDISAELIEVGIRDFAIPRERMTVGDATSLPFEDRSFDVACVLGALHHSARPQAMVAELLRVARYGVVISDEGNHLSNGIKSILVAMGIFAPIYRRIFRREPREARRAHVSDGDGPTYAFSIEEVLPLVRDAFPKMKTLTFYQFGRFQTCAFWYPRIFAKQVVAVAWTE